MTLEGAQMADGKKADVRPSLKRLTWQTNEQ